MRHLVRGAIASANALRRVIWIGNVIAGIVIAVANHNRRAAREWLRLNKAKNGLPVEIPARDVNQCLFRSVRWTSERYHVAAKIVRVRIDRQKLDISRQREFIGHYKIV